MKRLGFIRGSLIYRGYQSDGFATPSKKVELVSSRLEAWGFDPFPTFREPPESPYATPELFQEYPLLYTTWKREPYRHSAGRQIASLRKRHPRPVTLIHPDTARSLGIEEGDLVIIETPRGRIRQTARLTDCLHPKVVGIDYAWWFPEKGAENGYGWQAANVNLLTDDAPPFNPELSSTNLRGGLCRVTKADSPKR